MADQGYSMDTTTNDGALFDAAERIQLDPSSPVPLYFQMEQVIKDRITRGNAVGRMLPPEKDLMEIFGVSRATVKKTLENLVDLGLIQRRRALGTRVIRQEITEDLGRLSSYTEQMESRGLQVKTRVLKADIHTPDPVVRGKLQLDEGDETLVIERLRGTNDVFPVVLLQSEIPRKFDISPSENFEGSLYRLLEKDHRIPIEWAHEEIFARKASKEEARHLGIKAGDGVLVMERLTVTRGDVPLEFVRGVYRPEYYRYSIRLKR